MALSTQDKADQLAQAGYTGPTDPGSIEQAYANTATSADVAANPVNVAQSGPGSSIDPGNQFSSNSWNSGPGGTIQGRTQALINSGMDPASAYNQAQQEAANLQPGQTLGAGGPRAATAWSQGAAGGSLQSGDAQAVMAAKQQADQQLARALQAMAAANQQDFDESVRRFNEQHSLALDTFNLSKEKQAFDEAVTAAGLSGTYQGAPTQAALKQQAELTGMYQGAPTEAARQFDVTTARDLADMSSKLTGPADYFQFLNATNAGRNILGSLQSGQSRPAFGGTEGQTFQPQSLQGILGRLGIGGQQGGGPGGGQMRYAQGGIGGQGQSAFGAQQGGSGTGMPAGSQMKDGMIQLPNNMGQIPAPHLINPAVWDSWGKTGQDFIKGAASAAGLDPNWYEQTISATRPGTGTYGPSTQGAYSSGGESAF